MLQTHDTMKVISHLRHLAFGAGLFFICCVTARSEELPNVLFILTDDMGWDLASLGHPYAITPNMDRIVREGRSYENFYAAAPTCSPTRVSILTGHYPGRHGFHSTATSIGAPDRASFLHPDATTIFDLAKSKGYKTTMYGKWHMGAVIGNPIKSEYGIDIGRTFNGPRGERLQLDDKAEDWFQRSPEVIAEYLNLVISSAVEDEQPFFAFFSSRLPHAPILPSAEQLAVYDGVTIDKTKFPPRMIEYFDAVESLGVSIQEKMIQYLAAITALDHGIGMVLDKLDELGVADNTIVILTSDNGPEIYHEPRDDVQPGMGSVRDLLGRKRSLHEGALNVPFVVRWPGKVPASSVDRVNIVSSIDFLSTFADLWGIDVSATRPDGESRLSTWFGGSVERSRPLFFDYRYSLPDYNEARAQSVSPALAIRDRQWKLLVNPDGSDLELYYISYDHGERNEWSTFYPQVASSMAEQVINWYYTIPKNDLDRDSFLFWLQNHQGTDDLSAIDSIDSDGDGVVDFAEQALGTDASSPQDNLWLRNLEEGVWEFRKSPWPRPYADVELQMSTDLIHWETLTDYQNTGTGWLRINTPQSKNAFFRLNVLPLTNNWNQ